MGVREVKSSCVILVGETGWRLSVFNVGKSSSCVMWLGLLDYDAASCVVHEIKDKAL